VHRVHAASDLVAPEDDVHAGLANGIPGDLDLEGRQRCGVEAGWRYCGLWTGITDGHPVRDDDTSYKIR